MLNCHSSKTFSSSEPAWYSASGRMLQIVDVLGRKGGPDLFQIAALQKNAEFKDLIDLVPGDADDLVAVPGDIAQDFFVAELDQRLPDRAFC